MPAGSRRHLPDQLAVCREAAFQRVAPMETLEPPPAEMRRQLGIAEHRDDPGGQRMDVVRRRDDAATAQHPGTPPTLVATAGRPCAIASSSAIGIASEMLVISTMSPLRITPWGSVVLPMKRKRSPSPS